MLFRSHRLPIPVLLSIVFACAGCGDGGPSLYAVKGTVKVAGKPLPGVVVTFSPEIGPSSAGITDANGNYKLNSSTGESGAVAGKHKVSLTMVNKPTTSPEEMLKQRSGGRRGQPTKDTTKLPFPNEYADGQHTPLLLEVKSQSNVIDIPIP